MRCLCSSLVALVVSLAMGACEAPAAPGCEPTCATREPACDTCPAIAEALCVEGTCEALGARDATVSADVSIGRELDGVVAVIIAVVDGDSCDGLEPLAAAAGVLAGTRVDVSGGPFHPDLVFGEVPAGTVLVAADGLDDSGGLVGRGCVVVDVAAGENDVGVITID